MVSLLYTLYILVGAVIATASNVPDPRIRNPPFPRTGTSKTWLSMMVMMMQENQKLTTKIEKLKTDNEIRVNALQQEIESLKQMINIQPRSTRCYLGMKFGDIPDSALSSSTQIDNKHSATRARLDIEMTGDNFRGGWSASRPVIDEWIEVDLGKNVSIAGVILQGRSDVNEWVKAYKVRCDSVMIQEYGVDKVFIGNTDRNTKVVGKFKAPLDCQVVRIEPISYNVHVALRFELINGDCFDEY